MSAGDDDKAIGTTEMHFLEMGAIAELSSKKKERNPGGGGVSITAPTPRPTTNNAAETKPPALCWSAAPKVLTRRGAVSHLSFLAKSDVTK